MFDDEAKVELARAYWVGRRARYTGHGTGAYIVALQDLKGVVGLVVDVDGDVGDVLLHLCYPGREEGRDHKHIHSFPVRFYIDEVEEVLDV